MTMEHRILIVDDNAAIHEAFNKILAPEDNNNSESLQDARAAFFGEAEEVDDTPRYRLDSAFQGQDALKMVQAAIDSGDPYSMAFVDVRMPPGWDGVQTILELWKVAPELECVICTAFSDYTWSEMARTLGQSDKLLILKKPFDPVEARQFASTLTTKWQASQTQRITNKALVEAESQAKAYAASLETVNQALRTGKASADKAAKTRGEFLQCLSRQVSKDLNQILEGAEKWEGKSSAVEAEMELGYTLLNTVQGVVDYTRLESGSYGSQAQEVHLDSALRAAIAPFESKANAMGIQLISDFASGLDNSFLVDSNSVARLVHLLVDNALCHAGGADVTAKAWIERSGNWSKPCLHVQVSDSGPGLPARCDGKLYEPFTTIDDDHRFGIGLALAKQLVQQMGGDLVYRSGNPTGTQFTFNVRLAEPNSNQAA